MVRLAEETMGRKKKLKKLQFKDFQGLILIAGAVVVAYLVSFLAASSLFVVSWDWTAVPMFNAPAAPFTAGMGITLLISLVVGVAEVMKERK